MACPRGMDSGFPAGTGLPDGRDRPRCRPDSEAPSAGRSPVHPPQGAAVGGCRRRSAGRRTVAWQPWRLKNSRGSLRRPGPTAPRPPRDPRRSGGCCDCQLRGASFLPRASPGRSVLGRRGWHRPGNERPPPPIRGRAIPHRAARCRCRVSSRKGSASRSPWPRQDQDTAAVAAETLCPTGADMASIPAGRSSTVQPSTTLYTVLERRKPRR